MKSDEISNKPDKSSTSFSLWFNQTKTDKIPYNFLKKFFSGNFIGVTQDLDSWNNFLKVTK